MIDRTGLAEFLRRRREALQPEDVGLPRGRRRRTTGLRREEVASLCHMSTDYYARLERERGPQPSEQMIASIAQGLHLSLDERDHLFRLAGHNPPVRGAASEHVSPGLLRILDRLDRHPRGDRHRTRGDAAAEPAGRRPHRRHDRIHRPGAQPRLPVVHRPRHPQALRARRARVPLPDVRLGPAQPRHSPRARFPGGALRRPPPRPERGVPQPCGTSTRSASAPTTIKRFVHPELGALELNCQTLLDPQQSHRLLVYTAVPGSESYDKLQLLSVIGTQTVR